MLPLRLELNNFLAYRAPTPVVLEGIHLACLTGANGAGKSSLLDAITWALWGKARARRDEDLVHIGQNEMYVQLTFEQHGQIYRVLRRRLRKGGGTLHLYAQTGDGEWEARGEGLRVAQGEIDRLLRLDYDTFVHSAFLQQGKADAFTVKTPAERKRILSEILELSRWETYETAAKDRIKDIDGQLANIKTVIAEIDEDLQREPAMKYELAEAQRKHAELQAELANAEALMRELQHAQGELSGAHKRQAGLSSQIERLQGEQTTAADDIAKLEREVNEYETMLEQADDIEQGYQRLEAARAAHLELSSKMEQVGKLDAQRYDVQNAIDRARSELDSTVKEQQATIKGLLAQIEEADLDELSAVQADILTLEALESEKVTLETQTQALSEERAERQATNEHLKEEMNVIKDRLDQLAAAEGATCPLCGQPLGEAEREQLVADLHEDGTLRGNTFRANQTRLETITVRVKDHKKAITELDRQLKRLPALKERAGALRSVVDTANEAAIRLDSVQAQLDVVLERIEAEDFAHSERSQLDRIDQQKAELDYDSEDYAAAREEINAYQSYEQQHSALQTARESHARAQKELAKEVKRLETIVTDLQAAETEQVELAADIKRLTAQVKTFQETEVRVAALRTSVQTAFGKVVEVEQEIGSFDRQRERRARLEDKSTALRYDKSTYDELRKAFGRNGVPAMIIETAIPELEAGANQLLSRMTDGRMHLYLSTQRDKVTGGTAETLDIEIADELGTRNYDMYSGGEAFRINFALRVALSQMLARRAGARLRTLFIDEGFGTQDADGRNKLVEAITAVQEDFDMILVITHIDDLRDSFPVHVVVDKTPNGSQVSVR